MISTSTAKSTEGSQSEDTAAAVIDDDSTGSKKSKKSGVDDWLLDPNADIIYDGMLAESVEGLADGITMFSGSNKGRGLF